VPLEEIERQYILHVIQRCDGNMSRAAEVLQIDRRTLYRMMDRFRGRESAENVEFS
jgi:DNA-binding NtrC family response regulator